MPTVEEFMAQVAETERLLLVVGIDRRYLADGFIHYWLTRGKTPGEIVSIAIGPSKPDAHLGGIEA